MPNICLAEIRVTGYAGNVDEFTRILTAYYNYDTMEFSHTPHFFRVFDTYILNEETYGVIKKVSYSIDCAWSVYCCMMNGPFSYYDENKNEFLHQYGKFYGTYIQECARRLGLFIEIFSEEEGMCFNEYYVFNNQGYQVRNEEYEMHSYDLDEYKSREDFINKTGENISEEDYQNCIENCESYCILNGYKPDWITDKLCNPIKEVAITKIK